MFSTSVYNPLIEGCLDVDGWFLVAYEILAL